MPQRMTSFLNDKPLSKRPYLSGALFWVVFSLAAVVLRGVRWDENYEFAQVILGHVPYPEGHPLLQYVRSFYSLQTYVLAALMHWAPGPLLANLLRNWIFLAASTVPVFLLGTLFSRRQLMGHVAAIFILLEVHVSFYSTYPIHVWPGMFSNGPVGQGYMLVGLWALLDRRYRLAGLLLGFAPAIHLGQFPPLLATAALYGIYLLRSGQKHHVLALLRHMLPGLMACVAFAIGLHYFKNNPPVDGPYFSPVPPDALWHTYMARYATHRAIPYTTGHLVLAGSVLLGLAFLACHRFGLVPPAPAVSPERALDPPRAWAAVYCAIVAAIVWGIMLIHIQMGPEIPFILAGWIPYRLMNHCSPVLLPLLLAVCHDRDRRIPTCLPALLLAALVAPLAQFVLSPEAVARYLTPNAFLYFALFGAAAGTLIILAYRRGNSQAAVAASITVLLLAALALFHQFGAACVAVGVLLGMIRVPGVSNRALQVSSTGLALLVLLALLAHQHERRNHLSRSSFQRSVATYFEREGEPHAMILVPWMQAGDQAATGHPVMADMATLFHGIYRPAIAPAVNAIFQDFYGISLDPDAVPEDLDRPWHEVWPAKSLDEWQALAGKYSLRYVAAPDFMRLPLERIFGANGRVLYRIP